MIRISTASITIYPVDGRRLFFFCPNYFGRKYHLDHPVYSWGGIGSPMDMEELFSILGDYHITFEIFIGIAYNRQREVWLGYSSKGIWKVTMSTLEPHHRRLRRKRAGTEPQTGDRLISKEQVGERCYHSLNKAIEDVVDILLGGQE